jgi:hypothetical protein
MAAVTIDSSVSSSGVVLYPNPDLPINNPIIVDPENGGEPLPPTEFTSLNTGEIGAPVVFSPDSEAVIVAPVIVGAESGAAIATPTAETAQSIPATAIPSAETAQAAAAIATPTAETPEAAQAIATPTASTSEAIPAVVVPTAETAQNPAVIATPTIKTAKTPATVAIPTANTAQSIPATAIPTIETAEAAATISTPTVNTARTIPATAIPTANTAKSIPATAIPSVETAKAPATVAIPSVFTAVAVGAVAPPFPLNYARILYQNLLIGSSVSVTTGTGGSLTLIPNTYESWRFTNGAEITFTLPANADVDTFCVGAHNLGAEGFSVGVDFSSATTGAFSPFTTGQLPTDNKALMFHRSSTVDVRRIKLVCSGTGSISIGSIYAGVALQLMRPFYAGFTPPRWAEKTTYRNTNSSTGNFLGRDIVRVGGETSIDVNNLDNGWIETYFMPFKNAVKLSPYYIAWNLSEHPLDVALCQTSDDVELSPNGIRDLVQASWSAMIYGSL